MFFKITPFLIVFGIVELILVYLSFNYLFVDNKGGMALAGTIALIAAILNIIILAVEQAIANKISNQKTLWVLEIIIIIILGIYIGVNGLSIG